MSIPDGFAQTTLQFTGVNLPHGGAIVLGHDRNIELTAAEHATAVHDAFADAFMSLISTAVTLSGALCKFGPDETGASGLSTGIPRQGTVAGLTLAPNTAILLTKTTSLGGRRGKGRMFVPGVNEDYAGEGGVLTTSVVNSYNTAGASFLAAMNTLGMPVFLLHDPPTEWALVNGQPRRVPTGDLPPVPTAVSSLSCSTTVATQRRRLR